MHKEDILEYLYKNTECRIQSLTDRFGISLSTAQRLVRQLINENWAIVNNNVISYMPLCSAKFEKENMAMQNALAYNAVSLIKEHDVVCLSGGSATIALMMPFIALNKKNIIIITNSFLVFKYYMAFHSMAVSKNIRLIVIGGTIRKQFYSFGGEYAESIIHRFNIEKTFMGTESADIKRGLFSAIPGDYFIESNFFAVSNKTYLVTSKKKFEIKKLYKWGDWNDFSGIVSDYDLSVFSDRKNFHAVQVSPSDPWTKTNIT